MQGKKRIGPPGLVHIIPLDRKRKKAHDTAAHKNTDRSDPAGKRVEDLKRNDEQLFYRALAELEQNPLVRRMDGFTQHRGNATLGHCRAVAVFSFRMAQRLGWDIDEKALATGAMLHDYYLYNRKKERIGGIRHLCNHPALALRNAERVAVLGRKERNIIRSHMWPMTPLQLPRCREAWLVTLADKYCAAREFSRGKRRKGPAV